MVNGWLTWGFATWLLAVVVLKCSIGTGQALLIGTTAAITVTLLARRLLTSFGPAVIPPPADPHPTPTLVTGP